MSREKEIISNHFVMYFSTANELLCIQKDFE